VPKISRERNCLPAMTKGSIWPSIVMKLADLGTMHYTLGSSLVFLVRGPLVIRRAWPVVAYPCKAFI
jgi:hypothetical protein